MNFVQKRNALISAMSAALGCPVILDSQVQPEVEPPLVVYSVTSDYIPDGSLGHYSTEACGEGKDIVSVRAEQPTATFSFTACSINRTVEKDGSQVYILGADEAMELATLAQGFFLHTGRQQIARAGFVVVEVTGTANRDALELDEMGRRFGFDVRLRYTREDRVSVGAIENVTAKQNKE